MTGNEERGLVKNPDGSVAGVYSLSEQAPCQVAHFGKGYSEFEGKKLYAKWHLGLLRQVGRGRASAAKTHGRSKPAGDSHHSPVNSAVNVMPPGVVQEFTYHVQVAALEGLAVHRHPRVTSVK